MKRIAVLLLFVIPVAAQEKAVTITGSMFGDYYAVVSHHDERAEGMHGFWLRRGYLTFDRAVTEDLSARLRFEVNQPGDFRTSATLEPFVKDAYVRWRSSAALEVVAGLSPTPVAETVERVWGYRSVEKSPLDLQRVVSTRDLGVAVLGSYGRLGYHVQAGNGSGTGSETNEGKRIGGALGMSLTKTVLVEVYADHEQRPGAADRTTVQGFAAVQEERLRVGLQYAHQIRQSAPDFDLASIFAVYDVTPRFTLLGRVDRQFDPNPEGSRIPYLPFDPTRASTLFIGGVDLKLHKNVSLIPNVEYVRYDGAGKNDLLPRVTFHFTF